MGREVPEVIKNVLENHTLIGKSAEGKGETNKTAIPFQDLVLASSPERKEEMPLYREKEFPKKTGRRRAE